MFDLIDKFFYRVALQEMDFNNSKPDSLTTALNSRSRQTSEALAKYDPLPFILGMAVCASCHRKG